ncbi:MAG: hypothetical protein ACUZ8O_09900 [Candidatus Anammoxibacter sp.]
MMITVLKYSLKFIISKLTKMECDPLRSNVVDSADYILENLNNALRKGKQCN